MSDEQTNQQPDTSEPSPERQAELEAAYERQKDTDSPYWDVEIRTLGELNWIMKQRRWSGEDELDIQAGMSRANLSNARLYEANLTGARLNGANLREADLDEVNLSDAYLEGADLSEAELDEADLSGAHLLDANFKGARLASANLSGADLMVADLSGAFLLNANLDGANLVATNLKGTLLLRANLSNAALVRTVLDPTTTVDGITIDVNTLFLGVRWNGVPLDVIAWDDAPRLREPSSNNTFLRDPTSKAELQERNRQNRYRESFLAANAYHSLIVALRDQGLNKPASKYRLRELAMQRKALRYERNWGGWLFNVLLGAVAGHGEKPERAFVAYLGIVTAFAAIFWAVTNFIHTHGQQPLHWYEAIVLSLSSFHGRGFFTNTISLGDPLAIVGALEAVMGLFIELIFIATFSRRFLGD